MKVDLPIRERLLLALLLALPSVSGCRRVTPVDEITAITDSVEELPAPAFAADDWPVWRGPAGNGSAAPGCEPPLTWSAAENVRWSVELPGRGHSSPTVIGDSIYLATADESAETQEVLSLDRATGAENWRTIIQRGGYARQTHQKSTRANCTVACDGDRLFVAFLNRDSIHATALDLTGEILWQTEVGTFNSKFGYAPSPALHESLVLIAGDNQGGGWLAALHRGSGEIIWRKRRPAVSTYSSPIVGSIHGHDQLLISGCERISAFDPRTGDELWSCAGATEATCGTMVWDDQHVFASGGYPGRETICVKADGSGQIVWTARAKCYEQSMLVADGHLYAVDDSGIGYCWDATNGTEKWKKRLAGPVSASPVLADGHIFVTNERGVTFVFEANPEQYVEVARNQLGDEAFATPTFVGNQIYARVGFNAAGPRTEKLFCLEATD